MITFVKGDLFSNEYKVEAFAHGCNCSGVMGAGIALEFRRRWPDMYIIYKDRCNKSKFTPGSSLLYLDKDLFGVFCLATQDKVGANATIDNIVRSVTAMLAEANDWEINSIAMTAIGCGIGGLAWEDVKEALSWFNAWPGRLYVYEPHR